MRFANEALNHMSMAEIKQLQEMKLRRQLAYCYENSDYYRRRFKEAGADPGDIRTLEDFRKLPIMMTKQMERESQEESLAKEGHPFGIHLCAPLNQIELTSTTSGTTGTPTFTYTFSHRDINGPVSDLWAHMFRYVGIQPGDRVLFAYALGVYATSMLLWGIRKIGALPIDVDVRGGADSIIKFAKLTRPVSFATTPSLAEYFIQRAQKDSDMTVKDFGFQSLLLCGEPGPGIPEVKKRLEDSYGARVYDYWAPGGLGFGLSCDSDDYHGLHCYAPDFNLFQDDLVDPVTKEPLDVAEGVTGEMVHTSLEREACPVIRYAYGDIATVTLKECPNCGFKGKRMKFVGRSDDMLIVKGTNVYPKAIQDIIASFFPRVTGKMRIILKEPLPRVVPPLTIKVEYAGQTDQHQLNALEQEIKFQCQRNLKINPNIVWVPPDSLEKSMRKTKIFELAYEET